MYIKKNKGPSTDLWNTPEYHPDLFLMAKVVYRSDGKGGRLLVFDNSVHYDAKNLLKSSDFFKIISPFTNRGGIESIFSLLKKGFSIFQYVLGAVLGLLNLIYRFH